jgi:hypothetical protein
MEMQWICKLRPRVHDTAFRGKIKDSRCYVSVTPPPALLDETSSCAHPECRSRHVYGRYACPAERHANGVQWQVVWWAWGLRSVSSDLTVGIFGIFYFKTFRSWNLGSGSSQSKIAANHGIHTPKSYYFIRAKEMLTDSTFPLCFCDN